MLGPFKPVMKGSHLKKLIATAGVALAFLVFGIGYALASSQHQARVIYNGHDFSCSARQGTVYCATGNEPSYGMSFDGKFVMVMKFTSAGNRVVFKRWQP
jgi:hypothetical protein